MGASAGIQAVESERRPTSAAYQEILALCIIGVAALGGLAVRWLDLERWSLWWDEGYTAYAASLSSANVIRFAKSDDHPPLYYLLQHFWTALFGNSEFALRALSALAGSLALVVFYVLAKRVLKDRMATALAVWLFAFSMRQVWYSREARAYEVASFFALIALCALVLFLEKGTVWMFATVVVCSAVTLYLHTMMVFYLLALNVAWMIYPSERTLGQRLKEIFLADVLVGLLYLPWASSLLIQTKAIGKDLWWLPRPTIRSVAATLTDTAGFQLHYLVRLAKKIVPASEVSLGFTLSVGVAFLCGALLVGGAWRVSKEEKRRFLALFSYCVLPILVVFVLGQRMPLYVDRVFTPSSIVVPALFALPLAVHRGSRGKLFYELLGLILAVAMALSAFGFLRSQEGWAKSNENWRAVAQRLIENTETNRLIVFIPPPSEMLFDYYCPRLSVSCSTISRVALPVSFYSEFPPPKSKPLDSNALKRLESALDGRHYSEIDLVSTHGVDSQGLVSNYLGQRFSRQEGPTIDGSSVQVIRFVQAPKPNKSQADGSN